MKRLEVILIVVILAGIAFLVCGCTPAQEQPTLRSATMTLNTTLAGMQWKEAFGDSVDTAQSFNLTLLNEEFDKLKKRIEALEGSDTLLQKRVKILENR